MDSKFVVIRHELFKISEPFIHQQAESLPSFKPIYMGRSRFGEPPEGAISYALDDDSNERRLSRRLWQVLSRGTGWYETALKEQDPLLIHAHFGVEGVYALPLAKKLKIPLVTTFHGFDATTNLSSLLRSGKPSWVNYSIFRKSLARHGDLFVCVSNYIRDQVVALGFPEDRTRVHYIGIDTGSVIPVNKKKDRLVILHVGRLVEKKGAEYLIKAFAKIALSFPDAELVIVGDGPLKEKLKALANAKSVSHRIQFLGALAHDSVMDIMKDASVFVLPSVTSPTGDAEGLGMVLLEAAALGIPVIGTRHGGIPEVVIDGKTGYLVPERDVDKLADMMALLLSDEHIRSKMGESARYHVETNFDIRMQAEKLEGIYKALV